MGEHMDDSHGNDTDAFKLYDLRVEVVAGEREMVCNHRAGDYFELSGEDLSLPPGQSFPIYPLAALLPLLPAKQRTTHPHDWMTTDAEVACPDPHCGAPLPHHPHRRVDLPARRGHAGSPQARPGPVGVNLPWDPPASGVIRGCWQLSRGHGPGWDRATAFASLDAAASTPGPLVLDCADIYTGVEQLIGDWMAARCATAQDVVVHTKFVPDLAALPGIDRSYTRRIVRRARERLGVEALELVQFHWWDFSVPGWAKTAEWLAELREEGVIRNIGVTNFDCEALGTLLDAGVPIVSKPGPVLPAGPAAAQGPHRPMPGAGGGAPLLRHAGGRSADRGRRRFPAP